MTNIQHLYDIEKNREYLQARVTVSAVIVQDPALHRAVRDETVANLLDKAEEFGWVATPADVAITASGGGKDFVATLYERHERASVPHVYV